MWHDRMQVEEPGDREQEQPIWERTTPRGNLEPDDHDLDRGLERLESLIGH
jgi:hypothetical protein